MEKLLLANTKNYSSLGWSSLFSSASNICSMPLTILVAFQLTCPSSSVFFFTGCPKTHHITIFDVWSNKWLVERNNNPFSPVSSYTPDSTEQKLARFHCCQGTSPTYIWVLVAPQSVMSILNHCNELFLPWGRILQLFLFNLIEFLLTHSSNVSRTFWMTALFPSMPATLSLILPWFSVPAKLIRYILSSLPGHW